MSTAYHRLVTELFLLPALLRRRLDLPVPRPVPRAGSRRWPASPPPTRARTAPRPPGVTPTTLARCRSAGRQLGDHRYLGAAMAAAWGADVPVSGPRGEVAWLLGPDAAAGARRHARRRSRQLFADGGCAILRGGERPRLRRLRSRRARGPRRPRPQRHHLARRDARRRPAPPRSRHLHVHALARVAEPLPVDGRTQRRPGRRRGAEPARRAASPLEPARRRAAPRRRPRRRRAAATRSAVGHTGYRRLAAPVEVHANRAARHRAARARSSWTTSPRRRARALRALHAAARARRSSSRDAGARLTVAGREFASRWSGWEAAAPAPAGSRPPTASRSRPRAGAPSTTAAAARLGVAFAPAGDDRSALEEWLQRELRLVTPSRLRPDGVPALARVPRAARAGRRRRARST